MTTSGTTGPQKKVHVPLQALISNITAISNRLELCGSCTFLLVSPPTFDPSLVEILVPLFTGNSLLIPPTVKSPNVLFKFIVKTTHLMLTPSLFFTLTSEMQLQILNGSTKVTDLFFGGEPFPNQIIAHSKIQLWNFYGTTECSIWASLTRVDRHTASIENFLDDTIGRLIDGELWIGGPLRKCYVSEEKTALDLRPTGDLAEMINGKLFCLGRRDNQVKRSGYRINLNVISQTAEIHPFISAKALLVQDPIETLVLFVSTDNLNLVDLIKKELKERLDWFACPDLYLSVPKWPVNTNGKVRFPEVGRY
jgi:acyl-CoA synthetase